MRKSEKDKRIPEGAKEGASEDLRCPATVRRLSLRYVSGPALSRTAYIVSSVYEARFKPFTLAFTLLTPLRLRSLRMPLAAFLATTSRRPPPPGHRDQTGFTHGLRAESFLSLLFSRFTRISLRCL